MTKEDSWNMDEETNIMWVNKSTFIKKGGR